MSGENDGTEMTVFLTKEQNDALSEYKGRVIHATNAAKEAEFSLERTPSAAAAHVREAAREWKVAKVEIDKIKKLKVPPEEVIKLLQPTHELQETLVKVGKSLVTASELANKVDVVVNALENTVSGGRRKSKRKSSKSKRKSSKK